MYKNDTLSLSASIRILINLIKFERSNMTETSASYFTETRQVEFHLIRKKTKSAFLPHESPNHVHPEEQINVFEYSGQRLEPIQGPLWFLHKRFHAIHFLWQLAMAIFQV